MEVVLFSLYARTCDPAVDNLRMTGRYSYEQIENSLIGAAFDGVAGQR